MRTKVWNGDGYDTTDPALWPDIESIVRQYFTYKVRLEQLRRELRIANRMVRDAEEAMKRSVSYDQEFLTWQTD